MYGLVRYGASLLTVCLASSTPISGADEYIIDKENSIIGFVHHKRGIASIFIEDPLSYPGDYSICIAYDPLLDTASFELRYGVEKIEVAGEEALGRWGQAILGEGATEIALEAPSPSRRLQMRQVILSEKLLDAAKYPEIRVKSLEIKSVSGATYTHEATIEIRMHGEVRNATFPMTLSLDGDRISVSAVFPLRMTQFKIKPYSAFLGLLRFDDVFHVFMHLEADRKQ